MPKWRVLMVREQTAVFEIEAPTKEEAEDLASEIDDEGQWSPVEESIHSTREVTPESPNEPA